MQMQTRRTLAVLDDSWFYVGAGVCVDYSECRDLGELLELAEELSLTHIWLVPGSDVSRNCSEVEELAGWNITPIYQDNKKKERYSYVAARRNEKRYEDMIYVGFNDFPRWPLQSSGSDPRQLLRTINWLENILGLPLEWTPAHMSMAYVKKMNASRWPWLAPMTLDLEEKGFSYADDIAEEMTFTGQLPPDATHLVVMDGNSDYLANMTGQNYGEGNPEWVDGPWAYDGKRPGIWFVALWSNESIFNGRDGPDMRRQWMTTDLIEQLRAVGCQIEVVKGWTWLDSRDGKKRYHQLLRSTAESLWKLRVEWRAMREKSPAHENVYRSVSAIIKAIHGRFGRVKNTDKHEQRRDIWALTVAGAVARRVRKLVKILKEHPGAVLVKVAVDEFTFAVKDPHAFDAMMSADKLGGLKHVKTVEITEEVRANWK